MTGRTGPHARWTARPRSCGVQVSCCMFLGPSLAITEAEPVVHVRARVRAVWGREGPCVGGVSVTWCCRPGGEAWEPDAEPTGESWARASQPPGHKDILPDRPTTAIARGQLRAGHDGGGGGGTLDCQTAQVVLPWMPCDATPRQATLQKTHYACLKMVSVSWRELWSIYPGVIPLAACRP